MLRPAYFPETASSPLSPATDNEPEGSGSAKCSEVLGTPEKVQARMAEANGDRDYLRAAEAAAFLNVSPKTVSRWAKEGKVPHIVTLGGHRRFPRREIEALAKRLSSGEHRPD